MIDCSNNTLLKRKLSIDCGAAIELQYQNCNTNWINKPIRYWFRADYRYIPSPGAAEAPKTLLVDLLANNVYNDQINILKSPLPIKYILNSRF